MAGWITCSCSVLSIVSLYKFTIAMLRQCFLYILAIVGWHLPPTRVLVMVNGSQDGNATSTQYNKALVSCPACGAFDSIASHTLLDKQSP
jgi:hypothetical protein